MRLYVKAIAPLTFILSPASGGEREGEGDFALTSFPKFSITLYIF
jgi:acetyl-CoA carboxylase beta subunit